MSKTLTHTSLIDRLFACNIDINMFDGKTVMITGATGLIGKSVATAISKYAKNVFLILPVRNKNKLSFYLTEQVRQDKALVIECDIVNFDGNCPKSDYIIHCASITDSGMMVSNPIDVIKSNIYGTINVLEYAVKSDVKSVVYLSSMEAYGITIEETVLSEDKMQYLNPLKIRSCYPESKRMAENICIAYYSQLGLPIKIIRLAQTFGKGVVQTDKRVFAEFARCAINQKDIVLLTDGTSARMYLETDDAVTAILAVLLNGQDGTAYNAANKNTYCSIAQMASLVVQNFGFGKIDVRIEIPDGGARQFPPSHKFFLDTSRIEQIGWKPYVDLIGMYNEMIDDWSCRTGE